MINPEINSISELIPGDVIEFADITELPAFEDIVFAEIDPSMTDRQREAWMGRVALKDLIRPPKFNGSIANINLEVMENPYDRLLDANDRGWTFRGRGNGSLNYKLTNQYAEELIPRYRGFVFTADAKSSGRGVVGQISTEIWYKPVPRYSAISKLGKSYSVKHANAYAGSSVTRTVAKPKMEIDRFIDLDEKARHVGFKVLARSMKHAISTPIRN